MDPDECLSQLFEALQEDDLSTAYHLAKTLLLWIDRGGFYPGGGKLRKEALHGWLEMTKSNTEDYG